MALAQSKLELMFAGPPVATEAEAIDYMATSFMTFFLDSTVIAAAAVEAQLATADTNFRAALVGMSATGAGAAKITAAITAFWTAAMLSAPTVWITVPVILAGTGIIPPALAGMTALLVGVFATNVSGKKSKEDAAAALGSAIMSAMSGATVTLSPPPPGGTPLTPVL